MGAAALSQGSCGNGSETVPAIGYRKYTGKNALLSREQECLPRACERWLAVKTAPKGCAAKPAFAGWDEYRQPSQW